MINIRKANKSDIPELAPLFDAYRVFYEQKSDLSGAVKFLEDRFYREETVVFLAYSNETAIGFTQLFTSFSSVSMQAVYILNDLFVDHNFRKQGVGELLLNRAKEFCIENNYKGLALETAVDNPAQKLYERLGWVKDSHCFHYFWTAG
ncbi:GNAT family N-acetyltransferase [Poritiphilus flavus]|uniref:GNAT family N-acetyltransferase n=1 Tax=Poritiphilus flavus TaxID=2697053 RepID=A0A6L9EFE5_9FLAO|nr:GNAT family N-acetyltransferase [Poritiphilus flavus]NAS13353.1 GNAT family N-acetyltransferase [Poritiphilus flavus]